MGTSLVVQWLRLHSPNAEGKGSIPGQGTRSHMLHLRPRTAKEIYASAKSLSYVCLFVTPWTVAHQASLSMEFYRKECGVGSHSLLQGIFLTLGSNLGLLDYRQIFYCLR